MTLSIIRGGIRGFIPDDERALYFSLESGVYHCCPRSMESTIATWNHTWNHTIISNESIHLIEMAMTLSMINGGGGVHHSKREDALF